MKTVLVQIKLLQLTAATYSLAENSPNGTVVGTIEASDPDGDTLTYTICEW